MNIKHSLFSRKSVNDRHTHVRKNINLLMFVPFVLFFLASGAFACSKSGVVYKRSVCGDPSGMIPAAVTFCGACGFDTSTTSSGCTKIFCKKASKPKPKPKPKLLPTKISISSPNSQGEFKVSWGAVSDASNYYIRERVGLNDWSTVKRIPSTSNSYKKSESGLYAYQVKACNSVLCSSYSAVKSVYVDAQQKSDTSNLPDTFKYSMNELPDFDALDSNIKITTLAPFITGDVLNYRANIDLPALPSGVKPVFSSHYSELYVGQSSNSTNNKNAMSICNSKLVTKFSVAGTRVLNHRVIKACYLGDELVKVSPDDPKDKKAFTKEFIYEAAVNHALYWAEGAEYRLKSNPAIKIKGFGRYNPVTLPTNKPKLFRHTRWIVSYPNGAKAEFSNLRKGSVGWELQYIEDAFGNTIKYHHKLDRKNGHRTEVNALLSNGYKVEFIEEPSMDRHITTIYAQNSLTSKDKPVKRYIKQWKLHTQAAYQYTECGFDLKDNQYIEVCAKPLTFDYRKQPSGSGTPGHTLSKVTDGHGNTTEFDTDVVQLTPVHTGRVRVNHITTRVKHLGSTRITRVYTYEDDDDNKTLESIRVTNTDTDTYQLTKFTGSRKKIDSVETGEIIDGNDVKRSYKKNTYNKQSSQSRNYRYLKNESDNGVSLISVSKTDLKYDKYDTLLSQKTVIGSHFSSDFKVEGKVESHELKNVDVKNDTNNWLIGFVTRSETINTRYKPSIKTNKTIRSYTPQQGTTAIHKVQHYKADGSLLRRTTTLRNEVGAIKETQIYAQDTKGLWVEQTDKVLSYELGYLPKKVKNAAGHERSYSYHPRFRKPMHITDENDQVTEMEYSAFGEVIKTTSLQGVQEEIIFFDCNDAGSLCPSGAVYGRTIKTSHQQTDDRGAPLVVEYFSRASTVIAVDSYGIDNKPWRISHRYNEQGQLIESSLAHRPTESASHWNRSNYDAYTGSPRYQEDFDGSIRETVETAASLEAWGTVRKVETKQNIIIPATEKHAAKTESQSSVSYFNAAGRMIRSLDNNGVPTDFEYGPSGNLTKTQVNNNTATQVEIQYNHLNQKKRITDPDVGVIAYEYDGFGQIKRQIWSPDDSSARKSMFYVYDKLGRVNTREDRLPNGKLSTHSWVYDTRRVGALSTIKSHVVALLGGAGHTEDFYYSNAGQLTSLKTIIAGEYNGKIVFTYDHYGREKTTHYPNGLLVEKKFTDSGYLAEAFEKQTGTAKRIWKASNIKTHANGDRSTAVLLGNKTLNTQMFDRYGKLKRIGAGKLVNPSQPFPAEIQQFDYIFDSAGRLQARETWQGAQAYREFFQHDGLNRLTQTQRDVLKGLEFVHSKTDDYAYGALGNLTYRSDKGQTSNKQNLYYQKTGKAGLHAVTKAYGTSGGAALTHYTYDDYGNVIRRNSQTIEYNVFNKPTKIDGATFKYTANHTRYYQQGKSGKKTLYIAGGSVEVTKQGNKRENRAYVDGVLQYQSTQTGSAKPTIKRVYLHRDHLGSVSAMSNEQGTLTRRLSYNVWGERQSAQPTAQRLNLSDLETTLGYTGHEMLDDTQLIHMNGRVYDPNIGRFLSADIFVQAPAYSQSYNRYSYVMNSPLSNIDPSGYSCIGECYRYNGFAISSDFFSTLTSGYGFDDPGNSSAQVIYGFNQSHIADINAGLDDIALAERTNGRKTQTGGCYHDNPNLCYKDLPISIPDATLARGALSRGGFSGVGQEGGNGKEVTSNLINGGGLFSGAAAFNFISGDGSQWKGKNGKWYNLSWGGNKWTGARGEVLRRAGQIKAAGNGLFILGTALSIAEGVDAVSRRDIPGGVKVINDIGWGTAASFGGPIGLAGGVSYFGSSLLFNISAVRSRTITPIVDAACSFSGC